jgi:glycosyltransferase involved in cell wall biosynthesis
MLVSVLIDTYNHERYIEQAIVSVLNQDFPAEEMEIVVVDDGSTDRTPEIVRKFEPRVRLIRKANGGQASAFNVGIAETKGEIVVFLDGDDWWAREKLKAVVEAFEKNPGIAAVGHGYFEVIDKDQPKQMDVPEKSCLLNLSNPEAARTAEIGRSFLGTSRLAVRREALQKIGPIPDELFFCADTPILTLVLALGGALILDQPLCYYRIHSGNLFALRGTDKAKLRRILEIRKFLQAHIPKRLAELGVPQEIIDAHVESDAIQLERLLLQFEAGQRWRTFETEKRSYQMSYKSSSPGYKVFRAFVTALALILPPRLFYDLRAWYGNRHDLHRVRSLFGEAEPAQSSTLFQRRTINVPKGETNR